MKKRIVKVERNGMGLVAVTFNDGTVNTMIGMSATEMLAAQALADMEGEPATATLADQPKRIVKTGLVYLDRLPHPVSASLVYDDAASEDVGFDLAAFKLASQALDDRQLSEPIVGTLEEFKPRTLRLPMAAPTESQFYYTIRADAVQAVWPVEGEVAPSGAQSCIIVGGAWLYVRESPDAIIAMLGWDAPEAKSQPESAPAREVRVNLNAEVRCTLTAEGAARVNAHMETLPPSFRPRACKAGDAWSCQLWDLAHILGTHIGDPAPAVDNVLTLRVGDLVEVSP